MTAPTDRRASSSRWASAARSSGNRAWICGVSSPRAAAASAYSASSRCCASDVRITVPSGPDSVRPRLAMSWTSSAGQAPDA